MFNIFSAKDLALYFAEHYFISENYEAAITEYKRFIFFNPHSEDVNYAYYKIGMAYCNQGKWKEAIDALKYSIQTAYNDSIKNEREIALAIVLIARGNYDEAITQLSKTAASSSLPLIKAKSIFFKGIASLYIYEWKDAQIAFQTSFKYLKEIPSITYFNLAHSIDSLLSEAQLLKYKSPLLAKFLSLILPGLGQIYAGNWANGLNAFIINSINSYLLISALVKGDYTNAIFIYFPIFRRYYLGNQFHAEKMAKDYNHRLNTKCLKNILNFLSKQIN